MIFTVIVPFLDEEKYIERCLIALRDQNFQRSDYEIIFVDNGSTDRSSSIVKKYPDIIYLREEKGNEYTARNKAIEIAQGEILAFTDADCEVTREWLDNIYSGMHRESASIALGSRFYPDNKSLPLRLFEDYENAKIQYLLMNSLKDYYYGYAGNMSVHSKLFAEYGLFIEGLGDTEFIQRVLTASPEKRLIYIDEMRITHLEVANLRMLLGKYFKYGKYEKTIPKNTRFHPLNYKTKMGVVLYYFNENGIKLTKRIIFIILMILGEIFYRLGKLRGLFLLSKSGKLDA